MSWSIGTKVIQADKLAEELSALENADRTNIGNAQCEAERDEQINIAFRLLEQLLAEPCFGNAEELNVSLSGHANPDHKQSADGYANEYISLNVSVRSYRS